MAQKLLSQVGIASQACKTVAELESALNDSVDFVLVAEESVRSADLRGMGGWIKSQPAWSDLPIIVLTHRNDGAQYHPETPRLVELLGNVTFLERPFNPLTFQSVARTAHNGRGRQYEARALIHELGQSKEYLEQRVLERTAELQRAHEAVLTEIAQREKAEERLRQSQKMEMIGQLTGGVAHDFNNLLMVVMGNLELIRRRISSDAKLERLVDGAMQGARRGAALTQRLLAFARRQDLKVEPTNIAELLCGMNELIERSIGSQIELAVDVPPVLPSVLVDRNQIELAVLNLVVNARDAMQNGGKLTIEVTEGEFDREKPDRSYLCVAVTDTGFGMDAETLQKAADPFFSTKELGKGTGLGLSMVQGLARQLNGALRLSSEVGVGTRAEVWLPTTAMPAIDHSYCLSAEPEASRPMTVLVVDDDPLVLMSTALMVEDLGHKVVEANTPAQVLDILQSGQEVDLLITDFSMPRMNGEQLAKASKELQPNLPVLIATGYADLPPDSASDLPRIGKPYHQDQLAAAIANVMAVHPMH